MPSWLVEDPTPVYILLAVAAVGLAAAYWNTRKRAYLIGIGAVLVHAKDETAKSFYLRFGFEPSPTDPFRLFLLMKDIRANLDIDGGLDRSRRKSS